MARRNRKVPFNCYLSVDQMDALDLVSESEGRPRAEIVREAVEQYLARRLEPPAADGPPVADGPEERMPPESGEAGDAPAPAEGVELGRRDQP